MPAGPVKDLFRRWEHLLIAGDAIVSYPLPPSSAPSETNPPPSAAHWRLLLARECAKNMELDQIQQKFQIECRKAQGLAALLRVVRVDLLEDEAEIIKADMLRLGAKVSVAVVRCQ